MPLARRGEVAQEHLDLLPGALLEGTERTQARAGQRQQAAAVVPRRAAPAQQALLLETAQDPAQVRGVEAQVLRQPCGGGLLAVGELVQDANLGEREPALEQGLFEDTDLLRV